MNGGFGVVAGFGLSKCKSMMVVLMIPTLASLSNVRHGGALQKHLVVVTTMGVAMLEASAFWRLPQLGGYNDGGYNGGENKKQKKMFKTC